MSKSVQTENDLNEIGAAGMATLYPNKLKILIGSASCGLAAGAKAVEEAAIETVTKLKLDAAVSRTGCIGYCQSEPLVDLILPNGPRISYHNVTPAKMRKLLETYSENEGVEEKWALCRFDREQHTAVDEVFEYPSWSNGRPDVPKYSDIDFYRDQKRIILRNCGSIDPMAIEEAIARGAYRGAIRVISQMTPEQVIDEVSKSGLRGRGGAGFPTWQKWDFARKVEADRKYIICNADEGDPGAFMDRSVLESDPHAALEGIIIGAYTIGAQEAIIYVRSEYPLAVSTIQHAIKQAEEKGPLGENLFGSYFSLHVKVRQGAGAFVCGEETALIASIEGRAGEPRQRPPYPAVEGLWGKPTVINNVKTWASLGPILSRGAEWYSSMGTSRNKGTTVFSLVGAVKNTGLVEVPLGVTLKEMIYDIGGGESGKRPIKAIQTGGPSGGCIPASMFDLPIDYEKLSEAGSMMGSGGMIAIDTGTCMVDLARYFLSFTADESCGKCTPCREGTKQMLHILTKICAGNAALDDLDLLERLAKTIQATALCGLGSTAPNPVLTALRYFRDEFDAHIVDKNCLAGVCPNLTTFAIDDELCTYCGRCKKVCPVGAISGEKKSPHTIDKGVCTRCGACRNVCKFDAIVTEKPSSVSA